MSTPVGGWRPAGSLPATLAGTSRPCPCGDSPAEAAAKHSQQAIWLCQAGTLVGSGWPGVYLATSSQLAATAI
jgi:hypothetical protein